MALMLLKQLLNAMSFALTRTMNVKMLKMDLAKSTAFKVPMPFLLFTD
jgi:hypothetical protein